MNFEQIKSRPDTNRRLGILFGLATLFGSCTPHQLSSGGGPVVQPDAPSSPRPTAIPSTTPPVQNQDKVMPRIFSTPLPPQIPVPPPAQIIPPVLPKPSITPAPTLIPVSGGNLNFNAIPFVNMEYGTHATDAGTFAILESGGRLVAYGPMSASALTNGKSIEGGGAYSASQLKVNLKYRDASAPQSGTGELSICRLKNNNLDNISSANCVRDENNSAERPTSWYKVKAPYTIQNDQVVISNKAYGQLYDVTGGLSLNHIVFSATQGAQVGTNDDGDSPLVFVFDDNSNDFLTPVQHGIRAVYFDMLNLGFKVSVGWIKSNAGLLVLDSDGDGNIKNGSQLFGEASRSLKKLGKFELSPFMDGFEALAQYAETSSQSISAKDSVFSKLRIWRDKNQNGVSDPGELTTLVQEKIQSISLTKERLGKPGSWPKIAGNEVRLQGFFTRENGSKGKIFDVWFKEDKKTAAKK